MERHEAYERIAQEYLPMILSWAIKKTGNRTDGEDLAQGIMVQVLKVLDRGVYIERLEHLVWKVARYCRCNQIRALKRHDTDFLPETLPDGTDFASEHAESAALEYELLRMRQKIAALSRLQREVMILHYLDGLSVREIAERLCSTESAITWHLFDARKRVRKGLKEMKEDCSYIMRPGSLRLYASGELPQRPDTEDVNDSLVRQNICLLCYKQGKTADELSELTGVAKPYLEFDLDWLVEREFLAFEGKRYQTMFLILNRRHFEYRREIYTKYRQGFIDGIIKRLWENEERIRELGFIGCDMATERLMWGVITLFISYVSRTHPLLLRLKDRSNYDIHADGGKYHIAALDRSDGHKLDVTGYYDGSGWEDFYGICSDIYETDVSSYYWLGVYNFAGPDARPEIATCDKHTRVMLHDLYSRVVKPGFSVEGLSEDETDKLAEAIKCGLITKDGDTFVAQYPIYSPTQLSRLQTEIFAPLLCDIGQWFDKLAALFEKSHKSDFPRATQANIDHHVYIDLWMFGIFTLIRAAESKRLFLPETAKQGTALTLVIVDRTM